MYVRRIEEHPPTHPAAGRLGRHVRHDPRSLRYQVEARSLGTLRSVRHRRYIPVLDQGDLGSCTGNAALGAIGTGTLFEALASSTLRPSESDAIADEAIATHLYALATELDDYPGTYPPTDTGSNGLAVAKACQRDGLISGYRHATSLEAALTALAAQPVITGINWYDSFDYPLPSGFMTITSGAQVRGGHEVCLDELDVQNRRVWFTNSWGIGWGVDGRACIGWDDVGRLLDEHGDVTAFIPVTAPAPQPTPDPSVDLDGCLGQIITLAQKVRDALKGTTS